MQTVSQPLSELSRNQWYHIINLLLSHIIWCMMWGVFKHHNYILKFSTILSDRFADLYYTHIYINTCIYVLGDSTHVVGYRITSTVSPWMYCVSFVYCIYDTVILLCTYVNVLNKIPTYLPTSRILPISKTAVCYQMSWMPGNRTRICRNVDKHLIQRTQLCTSKLP